jgi:Fur family ferric uptake transcriptional regulator
MAEKLVQRMGEPAVVGEALRREGKRMTAQRALLLRIIAESDEHLDAEEIHRRARDQGARLSLATVYRTLKVLGEMGLLHELHFDETHHHYERTLGEHYHLICLECGQVSEHWPSDGGKRLRQVAEESGFDLIQARLELHGFCDRCRIGREGAPCSG